MKVWLILLLFFTSCMQIKTLRMSDDLAINFQKGLDFMKVQDYETAATYWENFLVKYPVTNLSPSAYYLWGRSLEKLDKCVEANGRYKSAYTLWGASPSKDKARTRLRIASCHLRLNETAKAIAVLSELQKLRTLLSWEDYYIERNSLLAIAYAKEGNASESAEYYAKVDKYIQQAQNAKKTIDKDWLSNLYYRLAMNLQTISQNQPQTEVMQMKQRYLVRIIEIETKDLANKAREELVAMYNEAYKNLANKKIAGDTYEQDSSYKKIRKQMQEIQASMLKLELEFSPIFEEGENTIKLKKWSDDYIVKIQNWINKPLPSQGLSPAAKERQSEKQKGKLIPVAEDPNL